MQTAYLLLGGNLGNVPETFSRVFALLNDQDIRVCAVGSLYASEPWGMVGADMFYNQAIAVITPLDPPTLMKRLLAIEEKLGRKRIRDRLKSRTIDIDILFYGQLVVSMPGVVIPHPRLHLRRFALQPLADIAPGFVHPLLGKRIDQLLRECQDPLKTKKVNTLPQADIHSTES